MKKIVIGITGLKGSGKDTAAAALIETGEFKSIKFADALKDMLRSLLSFTYDHSTVERYVEGDLKETPCPALQGKTPRYAMQTLGTEWGRNMIADSLWVDTTIGRIKKCTGHVVVTDLRFENEFDALKAIGAHTIRIDRGLTNVDLHPSETYITQMPVGCVIHNNGTVTQLREVILEEAHDWKNMQ